MGEEKTAIVAVHDEALRKTLTDLYLCDYEIKEAHSSEQILAHLGVQGDNPTEIDPANLCDVCIMELNLGSPGSENCEPARKVFQYLKQYYEEGRVKYIAISGNPKAVENGKTEGIPCEDKVSKGLLEFLKDF